MQKPTMLIKDDHIVIVTKTGPRAVRRGQDNYPAIVQAIKDKDWDEVIALLDPVTAVEEFVEGSEISFLDGKLMFEGEELSGYLVTKILDLRRQGFEIDNLVLFLELLQSNPSMNARNELYAFLETEDLPITEDGHFLAYKAVRRDFKDKHSGTIDNSVGNIVTMPRHKVDDNQRRGCSAGLHAGSIGYVRGFGWKGEDKFLIVKINPADVVCIPNEDCRKLRCCRYEVLSEMDGEMVHHFYSRDGNPIGRVKPEEVKEREFKDWEDKEDINSWGVNDDATQDDCTEDPEDCKFCDGFGLCPLEEDDDDDLPCYDDNSDVPEPVPFPEPVGMLATSGPRTKFCPECGEELLYQWDFCVECGAPQP